MYIERTDNMHGLFPAPPTLRGERLCLRPLSAPDAPGLENRAGEIITASTMVENHASARVLEKTASRWSTAPSTRTGICPDPRPLTNGSAEKAIV